MPLVMVIKYVLQDLVTFYRVWWRLYIFKWEFSYRFITFFTTLSFYFKTRKIKETIRNLRNGVTFQVQIYLNTCHKPALTLVSLGSSRATTQQIKSFLLYPHSRRESFCCWLCSRGGECLRLFSDVCMSFKASSIFFCPVWSLQG